MFDSRKLSVIPAKAGTHPAFAEAKPRLRAGRWFPRQARLVQGSSLQGAFPHPLLRQEDVRVGPGFRRDDIRV